MKLPRSRNIHTSKSFTLIELLVVIAIIALLSSIVLASLNTARSKARDANRVAEIKQLQIALEFSYDKYGNYPNSTYWSNDCSGRPEPRLSNTLSSLVTDGFIDTIPTDPTAPNNSWPLCYFYETSSSCQTGDSIHPYILIFTGENTLSGYPSWNNETNRYCMYP